MAGRNAIEGKFGQGKNNYGLAKIKARLKDTAESRIMSIYLVMNLVKLAQASFLSFCDAFIALCNSSDSIFSIEQEMSAKYL